MVLLGERYRVHAAVAFARVVELRTAVEILTSMSDSRLILVVADTLRTRSCAQFVLRNAYGLLPQVPVVYKEKPMKWA